MVILKNETEKAYPKQSTVDKDNEYRYLHTEYGNLWYSVKTDPMLRIVFVLNVGDDSKSCDVKMRWIGMNNYYRNKMWQQTVGSEIGYI